MNKGFSRSLAIRMISFVLIGILSSSTFASLPAVDSQGTSLPSLAPMLKRVTPAVVNIATSGTVRIQGTLFLMIPSFDIFLTRHHNLVYVKLKVWVQALSLMLKMATSLPIIT